MEDSTVAIITGSFAILLVLIKYIIKCICPETCTGRMIAPGCFNKPSEINPLIKLPHSWEDRWFKDVETGKWINDSSNPRGYCKWFYTKKNTELNEYKITLSEDDTNENAGIFLFFTVDKQHINNNQYHYLYCKVSYKPPETNIDLKPKARIQIKRFRTELNNNKINYHAKPKEKDHCIEREIIFGTSFCFNKYVGIGELYEPTYINCLDKNGDNDVDSEQLGLYFNSAGEYTIHEIYYGNEPTNVISWLGCCYSFYQCSTPDPNRDHI